jgi:hypothetical protein
MTAGKFSARRAAVAAIASVALMSGCTAGGWVAEAPPAAGSQAELSSLEKLRNMMFVVDDSGEGVLLGTISTVERTEVAGITYAPELPDGTFGAEESIDFTADILRQSSVRLEGQEMVVSNPELTPGRLAEVTVQFAGSGPLSLQVPVYSSEHEDFAEAWSSAVEG